MLQMMWMWILPGVKVSLFSFSWLIRWQGSRCPPILDIQPHLLSPVYPAHTSSPAPALNTHQPGHGVQPLLSNTSCCVPSYTVPSLDVAKFVGAEECKSSALLWFSISGVFVQGPVISATGHPTPPHIASIIARGPPGPGSGSWGHW